MKRNVLVIGIIVVVIAAIAAVYFMQQSNAANAAAASVRTQTVAVKRGSLVATLAEAGNVSALSTSSVAFQSSTQTPLTGRVAKVYVQVGDKVKAGQVLMELDPSDLQLALNTAQSNLASAQVGLSNAQLTLSNAQVSLSNAQATLNSAKIKASENLNNLIIAKTALDNAAATLQTAQAAYDTVAWRPDAGLTSQATTLQTATNSYQSALASYNNTAANLGDNSALLTAQNGITTTQNGVVNAQNGVTNAQNTIAQNQIAVQQAQDNLAKAKLVSPITGTVSAVNYNVGDTASSTAVVVVDLSQIQVKVTVAEVDISSIKVGQKATMTLDALPGKTYTATVAAINPVATISQGVVNYGVIVKLTDTDGDVLPGMTANLAIQTDRRDNVLLAPIRAIKTQGGQKVATVLYKGQQITTPVTTGLQNDTQVEVISGLNEGDQVVVAGTTTTQRGGGGGNVIVGGFRPGD